MEMDGPAPRPSLPFSRTGVALARDAGLSVTIIIKVAEGAPSHGRKGANVNIPLLLLGARPLTRPPPPLPRPHRRYFYPRPPFMSKAKNLCPRVRAQTQTKQRTSRVIEQPNQIIA